MNTTTFTYDRLNRLTGESRSTYENATDTDDTNDTDVSVSELFQYDADGNLTQSTDYDRNVVKYYYDTLNRRTDEEWMDDGSEAEDIHDTYDSDGNLLSATDTAFSGSSTIVSAYTYTYDHLNRQTSVTSSGAGLPTVTLNSVYDSNDNRTSLSAMIGSTADFFNSYFYDADNRMTQISQTGRGGWRCRREQAGQYHLQRGRPV